VRNTLVSGRRIKSWVKRIDKAAEVVMGMDPTCESDVPDYMKHVKSYVEAGMKHGYLATRINGSMERKNIVENFIDCIDLYVAECERIAV